MGGVQSVNEGPEGETVEYYSACGPILAGGPNDPSLYKLAQDVPGELPNGCPASACVKAGAFSSSWTRLALEHILLAWLSPLQPSREHTSSAIRRQTDFGAPWEQRIAIGLVWFTVVSSILLWFYYTYQTYKSTCGWEEFYVVNMETLKVCIELNLEFDSPAMIYQVNGSVAPWIRYAEWLLTCPVILIHLCNLTGLKGEYSRRTMFLLVSDLGTIVWGVSAANAKGAAKAIFFIIGLCYGMNTFYNASRVYIESFHMVPKGICRNLVLSLAWMFYVSWAMFPLGFVAGPEGSKFLSYAGSTIVHTFADLLSKNLWGFIANYLRVCIHKHIVQYGDLRKKIKVNVAGTDVEVEQYQEEADEETVKYPTKDLANRQSFINIRNQLQARGIETRASLDMSGQMGMFGVKEMGSPPIRPGRVILGVADPTTVDVFRYAFGNIGVHYEVVPAMGPENVWSMVQQASANGGFDFVLLHPEYLRDRTGGSLFATLQNNGCKVAVFGYEAGFIKDLVDTSGISHYIMGPGTSGVSVHSAMMLVAQMQGAMHVQGPAGMAMQSMGSYTMGGIPAVSGQPGMGSVEMQPAMGPHGAYQMNGTMGSTAFGMGSM